MCKLLKFLGLRLVLVADEYPSVFARAQPPGTAPGTPAVWTDQLHSLGNDGAPRHLLVVGGGSDPSMCYGVDPVDVARYPSYAGKSCNLNSDRVKPWLLGPSDVPAG